MADSDCMHIDAGVAGGELILFRDEYVSIDELKVRATRLQEAATEAKADGNHDLAVALYEDLLSYVEILDAADVFHQPEGMAVQLVERAIELELERMCQHNYPQA